MIALSEEMSMVFEPMDLEVASPATVSRCGVIYFEPQVVGWKAIFTSWLHAMATMSLLSLLQVSNLKSSAFWLVDPLLLFAEKQCKKSAPCSEANLVMSLCRLCECLMRYHINKEHLTLQDNDVDSVFLVSLVWSIGASISDQDRPAFSSFFRIMLEADAPRVIEKDFAEIHTALVLRDWNSSLEEEGSTPTAVHSSPSFPEGGLVFDFYYDLKQQKWSKWSEGLEQPVIPPQAVYSSIVIPTVTTKIVESLLTCLLLQQKPSLIVGATGTGKSTYLQNVLIFLVTNDKHRQVDIDFSVATIETSFSAKTSAEQLQGIIDPKMDRRKKGFYGPKPGTRYLLFVDDLNMPEIEEYGAQPPIELLRQIVDNKGYYDYKTKEFKTILDTTLVAAMVPERNKVTPRMLRHFSLLTLANFSDETLKRIFCTLSRWHLSKPGFSFGSSVPDKIVAATLQVYREVIKELLPTPEKSHYVFNLRDFSRVIQGIVKAPPPGTTAGSFDESYLIRLWTHEMFRVFHDRLTSEEDREWYFQYLMTTVGDVFHCEHGTVFSGLLAAEAGTYNTGFSRASLRKLFFGSYSTDTGGYIEVARSPSIESIFQEYLVEYNSLSKQPMDLVLFLFAQEHLSRICRIISMGNGNGLLVGVGGSGRQSLAKLAAFINDQELIQIEISKNYSITEWKEDLKRMIKSAGLGTREVSFLFCDTQITYPVFVEDINTLLNSGEIPNLFAPDEKADCVEKSRKIAKEQLGKIALDLSLNELWSFFVKRVRARLHVLLAFSPIGSSFRERLRRFPSLINCCIIDWFTAWPPDALVAVANQFLSDVTFTDSAALSGTKLRQEIVSTCQLFQSSVEALSARYKELNRRINYVTPTSYLELIRVFKGLLKQSRERVLEKKRRYEVGLEKLGFASSQVAAMQKQLTDLQPVLAKSQEETDALMEQIQLKLPGTSFWLYEALLNLLFSRCGGHKAESSKGGRYCRNRSATGGGNQRGLRE